MNGIAEEVSAEPEVVSEEQVEEDLAQSPNPR
jgi:hypothetical protein